MEAIEVDVTHDGKTRSFAFARLPIRFGRDTSCELALVHPFVSRQHGRIALEDEGIVIVDEGSTNGISHRGVRVPPRGTLVLGTEGGEFAIDGLTIGVRVVEAVTELMSPGPLDATSPGDTTAPVPSLGVETRTSLYADQRIRPSSLDEGLRVLDAYRAARADAMRELRGVLAGLGAEERNALVREMASAYGDLGYDPELRALADEHGVSLREYPPSHDADAVAREVEFLAEFHVPHAGPPTTAESIAFLRRIDRLLTATFEQLIDVELAASHEPPTGLPPLTGAEVRAHLLGWRNGVGDIEAWVRDLFGAVREGYERKLGEEREAAARQLSQAIDALSPAATAMTLTVPWWARWLASRKLWSAHQTRYAQVAARLRPARIAQDGSAPAALLPPSHHTDAEVSRAERLLGARTLVDAEYVLAGPDLVGAFAPDLV